MEKKKFDCLWNDFLGINYNRFDLFIFDSLLKICNQFLQKTDMRFLYEKHLKKIFHHYKIPNGTPLPQPSFQK